MCIVLKVAYFTQISLSGKNSNEKAKPPSHFRIKWLTLIRVLKIITTNVWIFKTWNILKFSAHITWSLWGEKPEKELENQKAKIPETF